MSSFYQKDFSFIYMYTEQAPPAVYIFGLAGVFSLCNFFMYFFFMYTAGAASEPEDTQLPCAVDVAHRGLGCRGTQFTCFTGTNVQILTPAEVGRVVVADVEAALVASPRRYSVYSVYSVYLVF